MLTQNKKDNSSNYPKTKQSNKNQLISPQKAANLLDVSVDFIRKRIRAGDFESVRIGRSVRIVLTSFEAFLSKSFKKSV